MRARRYFLLAGIAGGAMIGALCAGGGTALAAPSDMGSWGQAWGDDTAATEAPAPRPRATAPQQPLPATPTAAPMRPMPKGPAAAEIGGWGDAWGDGAVAPSAATAPTARPRAAVPAAMPVATAPAMAAPLASGPAPSEIRGWGDAWDGPAEAPAAKAPAPRALPVAASIPAAPTLAAGQPSPIRIQAPAPVSTSAPAEEQETPVQLTADQITYDRELGIVTARGRVEIIQEGRMLVADQVSYNLKQDIVSASGNVSLAEPSGDTLHSEYFELTGDLKEGVANQIRTILADNSRMEATSARRVGGNRTDFENGSYTACEPCRKHPERTPLWQAKAKRITHNQEEQVIEYRDAWMEFAGVPFLYTPYLSHPDPTVKRQSGFLTPTAGTSSNIGTNVTVPYFWAVKDNQDFTFAPRFLFPSSTTKKRNGLDEGDDALRHVVLAGEHRWRGTEGEERTFASLTEDKYTGDLRGHINSRARFDLNNSWRAGYLAERATDDTYTRIYSYRMENEQPWLTTRPYVEGFGRRSYTMAEAFAYQGLREEDAVTKSPIVLPHITTSYLSVPDSKGGYYTYEADMLSYNRSVGTDSTRVSNTVGWHRPFMGSLGDVTTLSTTLRGDAYHSEEVSEVGSANAGRVVPTVSANWRMPFARPSATMPQILEPMAMVAASPNGGNTPKIPNEDSVGFELDETNVFRPNRLPGLDRVEGGMRGAYGLRWQAFPGASSWVTASLAQGWRARNDSTFSEGSGLGETLSDYLARFDIAPSPNLALLNRIRLDKDTGDVRRNENTLSVGSPILRASTTYTLYERNSNGDSNFNRQHSVSWELSSALTRYWMISGGVTYDLTDDGGPRNWNTRLIYNDECLAFVTDMRREYTYDRDYLSGYSLTFNVVFKTLGSIPVNVF